MKMTFYTANCRGNAQNNLYPNRRVVENEDECIEVMAFDHICGEFKNYRRSNDGFVVSDVVVMDCDNDHTDDPEGWVRPQDLPEKLGAEVAYAVVPSRHNMTPKEGISARPRYHVYFPHNPIGNAADYTALKRAIQQRFPFFDGNALDAARFIYGNPCDEMIWHEGEITIDCIVQPQEKLIPQGQRNSTMSHFAGRVLKRYGVGEKAHHIFLEEAAKCSPPLDNGELDTIWQSACRFAKKVQRQEGYIAPEDYNDEFAGESLKPADYSDIGQAKVLAREYGNELKYTAATDYLRYGGQYWMESKQQAVGAMEEFLDLQLEDAKDELQRASDALRNSGINEEDIRTGGKALEKKIGAGQMDAYLAYLSAIAYKAFVMKRRDMKYVVSTLQAAKPMLEINSASLDKNAFLLNTPIGTYDLRKGLEGLQPHDPADLITKMTSYTPGEEGKELWLEFLDRTFQSNRELIDYVQQIAGLGAIWMVYVEALIISYGEGSNGKSTFWNSVAGALGTYSGNISADTLTMGCKRNVKPELAEAKGKRLLIAAELEEGMRLNTSVIKQLCSTDEIFAEKKYKDPFSFTPSHTLVLYTNHLPRVGAMDSGIWRRLVVIPFNAKITGAGDIKNFSDHLLKNAGPYILSWIIEGARNVIHNNFKLALPQCAREAIDAYRSDNDWLGHFLDECCEADPSSQARSGEVYQEYRNYCARTGEYTRSTADFYNALETAGFTRKKKKTGIVVLGMSLKTSDFLD